MRSPLNLLLGSLLIAALSSAASAQDMRPAPASPAAGTASPLTGKERLGRKWMDEQRIDNCNVPVDKRGARPRSDSCAHVPTG